MNRRGLDCFASLLERNNRTVRRLTSSDAIKFCCPIHGEDTPSANASVGARVPVVARCHVCGDDGSLLAMLEVLGASAEERAEILGGTVREREPNRPRVGNVEAAKYQESFQKMGEAGDRAALLSSGTTTAPVEKPAQSAGTFQETRRWTVRGFDGIDYAHVRLEDGSGRKQVIWSPKGVKPEELPLYGSELLTTANGSPVVITEGEKAADALRQVSGLVSLGTVTGADGTPSRRSLELLVGRPVILWPDLDDPGFRHMERLGSALEGLAASVSVVLPGAELGPKADAWDFVDRYGSEAVFQEIARAKAFSSWRADRIESRRGWIRVSAAELVSREIPEIPSLLGEGLLPIGYVSIAYGYPGVGKSFLIDAGLALAISRGVPWLGLETRAARVLVLAAEWPEAIAQKHLRQYEASDATNLVYVTAERLRVPVLLDRDDHVADLIAYASGFDLVIVDPLGRFAGVDLDVGFEAAKVMLGAQTLAASGPAVLLVHHSRKRSPGVRESFESDLDDLRGSGKLQSDPVTVVKIAKHPSGKIVIAFPKANFGRAPERLWISPSYDGPPELSSSPEEGAALRRREIREHLKTFPDGVTAEQVASDLKISVRSVRRYFKEIGAENVSGKGSTGLFRLPGGTP